MTQDQSTPANAQGVNEAAKRLLREADARDFHPLEVDEQVTADMRTVATAALSGAEAKVASIVPDGCTGSALAFSEGVLHVSKDGSGYIAVDEEHWSLEDDRAEGLDGPEGSVHWITRLDASEMQALRDFLNGASRSASPFQQDSGWRDMSSAPKDGTEFLAALSNGWVEILSGNKGTSDDWRYSWWTARGRTSIPYEPTHPADTDWSATSTIRAIGWMPLPTPPTGGSDA